MTEVPLKHDYIDAIDFNESGALLLGASNLTRRYWVGSMWYFANADTAPRIESSTPGCQFDSGVTAVKFIKGSKALVCGTDTGSVQLWNIANNHQFHCLAEPADHNGHVTSLSCNANNTQVISSSIDRRIKIWDVEDFIAVHTFSAHWACVNCVVCHPTDEAVFMSCSQDGQSLLWDMRKTRPALKLGKFCAVSPTWICWNPVNNDHLTVGTEDGTVLLVDKRQSAQPLQKIKDHNRTVTRMAYSETGLLATASEDCTVNIYNYHDERLSLLCQNKMHKDFVKDVCWKPSESIVFSCGWDGTIQKTFPNIDEISTVIQKLNNTEMETNGVGQFTNVDMDQEGSS